MKRFTNRQRVKVGRCGEDGEFSAGGAVGTVVRLRAADDGAWVRLDKRIDDKAHPFDADDSRGNNVLTFPEFCDEVKTP